MSLPPPVPPDPAAVPRSSSRTRGLGGVRRSSRVWDGALALLLAWLLVFYIDFKIRKPDELSVRMAAEPVSAVGVGDVELRIEPPVSRVRLAVDGTKEALARLRQLNLSYRLRVSREQVARALQGDGWIVHTTDLANVEGLPANIDARQVEGFPAPPQMRIKVSRYCNASIDEVVVTGEFAHDEGLELGEVELPATAVQVQILDLDKAPRPEQARLEVDVAGYPKLVAAADVTIPLGDPALVTRVRIGDRLYPARVLDAGAGLRVRVAEAREKFTLAIPLCYAAGRRGVKVVKPPAETIEAQFLAPSARVDAMKAELKRAAEEGTLLAVVYFPSPKLDTAQVLPIAKDGEPPIALVEMLGALPAEVEFVGVKSGQTIELAPDKLPP